MRDAREAVVMTWWILMSLASVLLLLHGRGRSAVWGSATVGFLMGIGVAIYKPGFDWWLVGQITTIAVFAGFALEWIPRIAAHIDRSRRAVVLNDVPGDIHHDAAVNQQTDD